MRYQIDCPFRALERIAEELRPQTRVIVVDFHAETTSEKVAMGWFADGRVSAVLGTHTHIQTADEKGLAVRDGVSDRSGHVRPVCLGDRRRTRTRLSNGFLTSRPVRFEVAKEGGLSARGRGGHR